LTWMRWSWTCVAVTPSGNGSNGPTSACPAGVPGYTRWCCATRGRVRST
jgi:hypothetical protein